MSGPARTSPARLHNNGCNSNASAGCYGHDAPPHSSFNAYCRLPRLMQLDSASLHPTGRHTLRRAGQASSGDIGRVYWQLELDNNCKRPMNLTLKVC